MTYPIKSRYEFSDLVAVMSRLRDPDGGCPWDLEQDFASIAPYTIEEAYEVNDAIMRQDFDNLREELGDFLFQPIFHAQMADEAGLFNIGDIIHDVTAKMIARHPHVFGDKAASDAEDVDAIWDQQKAKERGKGADQGSILDGVPSAFPALLRAHKLQKKVAKVGFEWEDIQGVRAKLQEELDELDEAQASGDPDHIGEELGDLLFVVANYARQQGLNAEELLRKANDKFERRFRAVEQGIKNDGSSLDEATLQDMEAQWQIVKRAEKDTL